MGELILEFDNPGTAPSINRINGANWQVIRRQMAEWRQATVAELRHAALRRPQQWESVAGRACTVQLDIGVTRINTTRDPHNYARLAKAIIDELKLQAAYAPGAHNGGRKQRLKDQDGAPIFLNQGWALWPDDTAEFVELCDATFHAGPTTSIIIRTKE